MFGTTIDLKTKLAAIDADLVSAYGAGDTALHAEIFKKLASLIDTDESQAMLDIEAMLDVVNDEMHPPKVAAGGFGSFGMQQPQKSPGVGMDTGKLLSMGIMLAGPVMAAAKFLTSKSDHEQALTRVIQANPQLFAQNRARAEALFEAVYSSAPNIGKNTVLMGDILKQLMAMPMVDMGTIARLVEMSKNVSQSKGEGNPFESAVMGASMGKIKSQFGGGDSAGPMAKKTASVKIAAKFKSAEGLPTIFNWGSPAAKQAGLTDAFTGSGTNLEQANQATMMNQQEQGNTLLPLDSVLHELLMKEMELQQREQVMQQQEQQLQQALQAVQQIGTQYQGQSGVDPNTGDPTAQAPAAAPEAPPQEAAPQEAPPAEEAPAEEAAPAALENADPAGEAPPAETGAGEQQAPEAATGGESPVPGGLDAGVETEAPISDEDASQQTPTNAEGDPNQIMAGGAEGTGANGDTGVAPDGADGEGEQSAEQNPPGTDEQGDGAASPDGTPGAEEQGPEEQGPEEQPPEEAAATELAAEDPLQAEALSGEEAPVNEGLRPGESADNPAGEEAPEAGDEAGGEAPAEDSEAAGDQAPAEDPKDTPAAEQSGDGAVVGGEKSDEPTGEEGPATPPTPPPVDMSPEAQAAGEAGLQDAANPMPPADGVQTGADPKEDPLTAQMRALHSEQETPSEAPEAGASVDPFSSEYSEGPSPMGEPIDGAAPVPDPALTGGEEEPAAPPAEAATDPELPAEGAEPPPPIAEGEDTPEEEEGAEGPNTAENVEGSVEDNAKDQALNSVGIEEGTPEEAASDEELAKGLNEAGVTATPPGAASAAPSNPDPMATSGGMTPATATPNASGGHEIVLPLRITVKIGEADPIEAARISAREAFLAAMNNLPNRK